MKLQWTHKALADLERLYEFLASANPSAAAKAVRSLSKAPAVLVANPRLGEQLFQFEPREVRRLLAGNYEIRYEIQGDAIFILRLWHTREMRS